jgi:outer membrane protein assembly factor BamB
MYVISREKATVPIPSKKIFIVDDFISRLSPEGEITQKISMWNLFGDQITREVLKTIPRKSKKYAGMKDRKTLYDLFHTNTVEIVEKDTKIADKGNILICLRNLDLIAIVDPLEERVVWSWGQGLLDRPHQPTILENGNILIFDNGMGRDHSRVIEYDPDQGKIVWEYLADPPEDFHSRTRGANQRLPNGNTLITESSKGRVFEVTGDGEIVWEFFNPHFGKRKKEVRRKTIYRMVRLEPASIEGLNHSR